MRFNHEKAFTYGAIQFASGVSLFAVDTLTLAGPVHEAVLDGWWAAANKANAEAKAEFVKDMKDQLKPEDQPDYGADKWEPDPASPLNNSHTYREVASRERVKDIEKVIQMHHAHPGMEWQVTLSVIRTIATTEI